ncbi:hypothetical protein EOS_38740 [Caballeronia mineralivorans PML1(12)]|uniref:Uncharacterized protein n=1 Tax=Caballeronia mineralivorans PML1(12) TaxID=908627 RepID=A0A0J1FMH6_9BURK|nr:hypothetical protein EOS_38740 [Caballeronia mineralivorans PML1(12)]
MRDERVIADIGSGLDGLAQAVERFLRQLFAAAFFGDSAPPDAILTIFIAPVRNHSSASPIESPYVKSRCVRVRV